jgi:hypothetical protein
MNRTGTRGPIRSLAVEYGSTGDRSGRLPGNVGLVALSQARGNLTPGTRGSSQSANPGAGSPLSRHLLWPCERIAGH